MKENRENAVKSIGADALAGSSEVDSSGVVASGESEQALLAAGKISVDEFIDISVDRALSHLQGQISEDRLKLMQGVLRSQLEQDPHLAALVEQVAQKSST